MCGGWTRGTRRRQLSALNLVEYIKRFPISKAQALAAAVVQLNNKELRGTGIEALMDCGIYEAFSKLCHNGLVYILYLHIYKRPANNFG